MEILTLLFPLFLIGLSCLIIWRSSDGFEIASDFLGRKLPLGIKGASLNAIASSMPEFLTTIFFLFYLNDSDGFSGGLGVTSGSAMFNLLIIPAIAVILVFRVRKGEKIALNKDVLAREGIVLVLSQIIFIAFLFNGELNGLKGLIMVLIYTLYLFLLFRIAKRRGTADPGYKTPVDENQHNFWIKILSLDLTHAVLNGRKLNSGIAWLLLIVSTGFMTAGTWMLVLGTDLFGERTNIPLIFVAVVLSAAATSIPDTIISIKDARKGNYDDAVSNALGSNIFDIAFALGLPILLYNLIYGKTISLGEYDLGFTKELWVFLVMATIVALTIMISGRYFTKTKAYLLLSIYAIFLVFIGTQVHGNKIHFGQHIFQFLTNIADAIGKLVN